MWTGTFYAYRSNIFDYDEQYLKQHRITQYKNSMVKLYTDRVSAKPNEFMLPAYDNFRTVNNNLLIVDSIYYDGILDYALTACRELTSNIFVVMNVYDLERVSEEVNFYDGEGSYQVTRAEVAGHAVYHILMSPRGNPTQYSH